MTKIACFIPIKNNSSRVPNKNLRLLRGIPLYRYALDTVINSKVFDDVFVDTDSEDVKNYCIKKNINIIDRDPKLLKDSANGNDLLEHWVDIKPNYDVYFQVFVTSPFLTPNTLKDCVNIMKTNPLGDSVFTVIEDYTWYWFNGKPVNYNPKLLPRSQDAKPIIKETTSLYGISKEGFNKTKSRIGESPQIYVVDEIEGTDIDTEFDFIMAKLIAEQCIIS
jgi:N-acylneuraminate cytidylyltransferase